MKGIKDFLKYCKTLYNHLLNSLFVQLLTTEEIEAMLLDPDIQYVKLVQ